MLLTTVLLWALNLSVTKYILTHGFLPLPYASVRYGLAGLIFVVLTLCAERTFRIERRHLPIVAARCRAAVAQPALLRLRSRSDDGVDDRPAPRSDPDLHRSSGLPRHGAALRALLDRRTVSAPASVSSPGSGSEATHASSGSSWHLDGGDLGCVLGHGRAADEDVLRSHVSAIVIPATWAPLTLVGMADRRSGLVSAGDLVAPPLRDHGPARPHQCALVPLDPQIGANKATLAANLQPFVAAVLAVILLSEPLSWLQIAGGVLIGSGSSSCGDARP